MPFPEATLIPEEDRPRMLAVALCGPRVLWRLQSIGIRRFSDLSGKDPFDLMGQINIEAGRSTPSYAKATAERSAASSFARCGRRRTTCPTSSSSM